jgi:homoserine dehydrogenase
MTQRWEVGILGATGMVGQQLVRRLEGHPWFRLAWVAASERSGGRRYGELSWLLGGAVPVIRGLQDGLAGDRVMRIAGVVNGTCNFVLGRRYARRRL